MSKFSQYPKWMHHPEQKPAIIEKVPGIFGGSSRQVQAEILPDKQAKDLGEEENLISQGYLPRNNSDRETYERIMLEGKLPSGQFIEYPKWKYSKTELPLIVNNEKEESSLKGEWFDAPVDAYEDDIDEPIEEEVVVKARPSTLKKIDKRSKEYRESLKA